MLPTNEQRSAAEVAAFVKEQPSRYFAYAPAKPSGLDPIARLHHGDKVSTWTGDTLGTITQAGEPWRDNFGGIRQAFTAKCVNGCKYHGVAYLSAGDYVRMKKAA